MCTGIELAAVAGAATSVYSAAEASNARDDAKAERSKVAAERAKAETDAANKAAGRTAMMRKALRDNSLFTGAGDAGLATPPASGRTQLGV